MNNIHGFIQPTWFHARFQAGCVCMHVYRVSTADKLEKGNSVAGSRYCNVYPFESDLNFNVFY